MSTVDEVLDKAWEVFEFAGHDIRPDVNSKGLFGNTPIFAAISWGDLESVKLLLAAGANINVQGERQDTPLHHAIQMGEFEIARLLVQNGADIEALNKEAKKPRDYCWESEWPDIFGDPNA